MYAVIFYAEFGSLGADYANTAARLRELALSEYGCREFISCAEGSHELAVSYWDDEAQIKRWKRAADHLAAQRMGREKWYKWFRVQVADIVREYDSG